MKAIGILLLGAVIASPAAADVKASSAAGFEVESRTIVGASPAEAYAMLVRIGDWWDSAHTYSGNSANMSLEAEAGGCFCESLPKGGGTVEHMRVVYAQPGVMLRLQGGLGPLQAEAISGTLTWVLKAVPGGTEITQTYIVGGYVRGGAAKLAPLVDQVLRQQLSGLERRLLKPRPKRRDSPEL